MLRHSWDCPPFCGACVLQRKPRSTRPEFPAGLEWLNVAFLRMNTLMGRGAVLVEFWDFARVNSLRTLPYLKEWHERYRDAGLRVIGVHTPGYSFGRDRDTVARAVERLEIEYPVLLDPDFEIWREYGNKGWPGRYLFDRTRQAGATSTTGRASTRTPSGRSGSASRLDAGAAGAACAPRTCPASLLEPQTADIALPGRPRAARAGARLDRRRGLDRGRRRGRGGELRASAPAAPTRCCRGPASSRGSTRWTGRSRRSRPASASTACSSRLCRQRLPDLLREHEAHVLLDDLELRDVRRCRARGRTSTRRCTSSSGALAPEVMPTTRLPSSHSSCTWASLSIRCDSAPWSRATSTSRFELDELREPITSTRSHSRAIWRTASWRFVVA